MECRYLELTAPLIFIATGLEVEGWGFALGVAHKMWVPQKVTLENMLHKIVAKGSSFFCFCSFFMLLFFLLSTI